MSYRASDLLDILYMSTFRMVSIVRLRKSAQQLHDGRYTTAAVLQQLHYGSYATTAILQQLLLEESNVLVLLILPVYI